MPNFGFSTYQSIIVCLCLEGLSPPIEKHLGLTPHYVNFEHTMDASETI